MPFLNPQIQRWIERKIRTYNRARRPFGEHDFIHFASAFYDPNFVREEAERVWFTVRHPEGHPMPTCATEVIAINKTAGGWSITAADGDFLLISGPSGRLIDRNPELDHHPRLASQIEARFDDLLVCREVTAIFIGWKGRDAFFADNRKRTGSGWNSRHTIAELRELVGEVRWEAATDEMRNLARSMDLSFIHPQDQGHNRGA